MVKVIIDEDCGNAPKKQYIKEFLIASADANIGAAVSMVTDDIHLEIPGYKSVHGKGEATVLLTADSSQSKMRELVVSNILSHGDRCAANGIFRFEDGGEVAFCGIYVFNGHAANAKLKEITIYSVQLPMK